MFDALAVPAAWLVLAALSRVLRHRPRNVYEE